MKTTLLYHKDIYMPSDLKIPSGSIMLKYSRHALDESKYDKYGEMELPEVINFSEFDVIEVGVDQRGRVLKVLIRGKYDEELDICLVVMPDNRLVRTVWFSRSHDTHATLRKERYVGAV